MEERIDLLMAVERTNKEMTFSSVLLSCALYRLLIEGRDVKEIGGTPQGGDDDVDKFMPLLKSLAIVNATWGPEHRTDGHLSYIEDCARGGRFEDLENDPAFFYRFAAYTLSMLANNDQFFEDLMGTVTESFDFNGMDTRNCTDFIEKHARSIFLGRRAFLMSRPSAFLKRLARRANEGHNISLKKLAKLMMVKSVDSNGLSISDLVLCCIQDEDSDMNLSSSEEYHGKFYPFGKKEAKMARSSNTAMASNSCSNEQLSRKLKVPRPNDVRVQFNKRSEMNAIERDEDEDADLSYGLYTDTVEKAIVRTDRANDMDEEISSSINKKRKGQRRDAFQRDSVASKDDFFDHGSRDDTTGIMSGYAANSTNSSDGHSFFREKDIKVQKDAEFTDDDMIIAVDNIAKLARRLMRQDKIKENVRQMIDAISESLMIPCPISCHEDPRQFGLSGNVVSRTISAVKEWNDIVTKETIFFKEECKEIEKNCTYDMRMVICGDYSGGGGPVDEVHVFKNPLVDIVSAEGLKRKRSDSEDDDKHNKKRKSSKRRRDADDADDDIWDTDAEADEEAAPGSEHPPPSPEYCVQAQREDRRQVL
ncbi:hypothetical protein Pcinc_011775 [Petrolisthes cinctipes]|uniref:Uncharacterized protein n=1 Tax=Petrolisthes cinctipes TaxID=88211 RepID=A0AAE1G0N0_PETCI|nr:hypothetical protein Pcinc_011775 [Petrolisthes cinctipes]